MAGIKVLKLNIEDFLRGAVDQILAANNFRKYLSELSDDIYKRTRAGYGVARNGAARQSLKPLSQSYKQQRSKSKDLNKSVTSPRKSNLSFTGELLDSISVGRVSNGTGTIVLEGSRQNGLKNSRLGAYVSDERPFLNVSDTEKKKLIETIRKDLISLFKKKR